ncbi:MAG: endonuclease/exonuclease/phosphatase family protein [Candidatus Yanofskybacteria bacterium]|nr:endonuclease/exonuclease/phosphatase family protein [Candidatus Yanofskybacteria bacterium]
MKKHLNAVQAFLQQEQPDVVCMQEVYGEDLQTFAEKLGMDSSFGQMILIGRGDPMEPPMVPFGIGILSRFPLLSVQCRYYKGDEKNARQQAFHNDPDDFYRLFLCGTVRKGESEFVLGTTHFTWNADGQPSDAQREDVERLLDALGEFPEVICCGDFNAPREGEIFQAIAASYKDNIPARYTTSIDIKLHRSGEILRGKPLLVDGLFTTPQYQCKNVRLQDGVSDHMAVLAEISRIEGIAKREK